MSVKVSLKESVFTVKYFPKLMIGDKGVIILFQNDSEGVVVFPGDNSYNVGYYYADWASEMFKDYNEEVTLKNE